MEDQDQEDLDHQVARLASEAKQVEVLDHVLLLEISQASLRRSLWLDLVVLDHQLVNVPHIVVAEPVSIVGMPTAFEDSEDGQGKNQRLLRVDISAGANTGATYKML